MSTEIPALKQSWRAHLRAEDQRHGADERREASRRLCERVAQSDVWRAAKSVLVFGPRADEPDIRPLIAAGLASGKIITFPRHVAASDTYEAAVVRDLARDLIPARFGLREPAPECPGLPLMQLDLVLVPAVAFDAIGRRLGRGKGYYDQLLSHTPAGKCGIAFDWQVVDELPTEPHDAPMNYLATPTRWLVF
ncbi:5-formyltetrahydrofolate cyclo-ligase [Verrucomicrobiota bacterium]|nr:5-formyltetrahydrofolate cyclo-ligase [Verrucomicrobiota bacterium]